MNGSILEARPQECVIVLILYFLSAVQTESNLIGWESLPLLISTDIKHAMSVAVPLKCAIYSFITNMLSVFFGGPRGGITRPSINRPNTDPLYPVTMST